jgi:putative ABC transport system permease protein
MTSAWLALRTVQRYRARTVLSTIGVAIIGALLFDMLLLSRGLVVSFADLLDRSGYDIRVLNSEGLSVSRSPIPDASNVSDAIARLPEVASVARIRIEPGTITGDDAADLDVTLIASSQDGMGVAGTIVDGKDLSAADTSNGRCPVLVGRNVAAARHLRPGALLHIRVGVPGERSAMPPVACHVVGVADSLFASANDNEVLVTMRGLQEIHGGTGDDEADVVLVASSPSVDPAAAVRAIAALRPDLHVYSNADVVDQFNRNGFAYFRQISVVLSSITVVFTFLLVATILTVSTNQRLGEIAALRALGIGRRRIATMLLWESVLIVGGGGLVALPLGGVVAAGLDRILKQMPGVPDALHFFVFEPRAVGLHVVLLSATALVAAIYPMWLTARLPIAATLRREVVG